MLEFSLGPTQAFGLLHVEDVNCTCPQHQPHIGCPEQYGHFPGPFFCSQDT
ncbi:hypothetical protein I79_002509 [Cricetulus griseus]|uniref:Uncharacterized protein n=1 Tax=Cricetulus griseus TaxID=10029 RepID=G3GXL7_CRIGR|nr:hypothetical protein I79_002509 [Cricetulus griseus]